MYVHMYTYIYVIRRVRRMIKGTKKSRETRRLVLNDWGGRDTRIPGTLLIVSIGAELRGGGKNRE